MANRIFNRKTPLDVDVNPNMLTDVYNQRIAQNQSLPIEQPIPEEVEAVTPQVQPPTQDLEALKRQYIQSITTPTTATGIPNITDIGTGIKQGKGLVGKILGGIGGLGSYLGSAQGQSALAGISALTGRDPLLTSAFSQQSQRAQQREGVQQQLAQQQEAQRMQGLGQFIDRESQREQKEIEKTAKLEEKMAKVAKKSQEAAELGNISKEMFKREEKLRTEYFKNIKDFPSVRDSFRRVTASIKNPSAAVIWL